MIYDIVLLFSTAIGFFCMGYMKHYLETEGKKYE